MPIDAVVVTAITDIATSRMMGIVEDRCPQEFRDRRRVGHDTHVILPDTELEDDPFAGIHQEATVYRNTSTGNLDLVDPRIMDLLGMQFDVFPIVFKMVEVVEETPIGRNDTPVAQISIGPQVMLGLRCLMVLVQSIERPTVRIFIRGRIQFPCRRNQLIRLQQHVIKFDVGNTKLHGVLCYREFVDGRNSCITEVAQDHLAFSVGVTDIEEVVPLVDDDVLHHGTDHLATAMFLQLVIDLCNQHIAQYRKFHLSAQCRIPNSFQKLIHLHRVRLSIRIAFRFFFPMSSMRTSTMARMGSCVSM